MKLQIGETLYELEYKINSICDLEELTGKGIDAVMRLPETSGLRALLWCGLIAHHKITFKQAGDLLEEYLTEHGYEAGKELLNVALAEAISQAGFLKAQGNQQK